MALFQRSDPLHEQFKKQLNRWFREAEAAHSNRRDKWRKLYSYYVNQSLPDSRPAYKSNIRANYCFMVVETKIPVLTQNRPTGTFIAHRKEPDAEQKAQDFSRLIGNALWHKNQLESEYHDVCWNASVFDDGFWKVFWDPDADDGKGEVRQVSIDPFKIMMDPAGNKIESCRYIIHCEPYPVQTLRNRYPKYAKQIGVDARISEILFEDRKFSDRKPTSSVVTESTRYVVERALLKEFWIKPEALGPDPQADEDTEGSKLESLRKKYPRGAVVTQVGDVVVEAKEWPYRHKKFPFVKSAMHRMANEPYDIGDIEQIAPLQDALNHVLQQIDDITSKISSPIWKVSPRVGLKNAQKIKSAIDKPGALIIVDPEDLVSEIPPGVPPHLIRLAEELTRRIFDISGISEIIQGSGRVTHRTAAGIQRLYEAATTRIGQSGRNSEAALREVFIQSAALVQQFYKEERTYAVIGGNGVQTDVLEIPKDYFMEDVFSVSIDSATALPQDRQSRAELVFNLLKNQVFELATSPNPAARIAAKAVLDAVEFPGREDLLAFGEQLGNQQPEPETPGEGQVPPGEAPAATPNPLDIAIEQIAAAVGVSPEEVAAQLQAAQQ